jgi:hypothetical protein
LGTNDIETLSPQQCADGIISLAADIQQQYKCNVFVSEILPRGDHQSGVDIANDILRRAGPTIRHPDIAIQHLYDKKHLDRYRTGNNPLTGTQLLAKDVYRAMRNCDPTQETL